MTDKDERPTLTPEDLQDVEACLRQDGETPAAYRAFLTYLSLGPGRSLVKANAKLNRRPSSVSDLKDWSVQNKWQERVRAYDDAENLKTLRKLKDESDKARDRIIGQSVGIQHGMTALVAELVERYNEGRLNLAELGDDTLLQRIGDFSRAWERAVNIEARLRGEPTERVAVEHSGRIEGSDPIAQLIATDPDARAAAEALMKAAMKKPATAPPGAAP